MWETSRFQIVFVDDQGSCTDQHILVEGPWHRYQDRKGNLYALRCPLKLSYDETARVIEDLPPGSWEAKMAGRKEEKLNAEADRKREEKRNRSNGWRS